MGDEEEAAVAPDSVAVEAILKAIEPDLVCFISEPRELVWRSVTAILHSLFGSIFYIFSIFSKNNPYFRFFWFQTQENRFWGLGTFLALLLVQQFNDLFTILKMFYKFSLILCINCSYEPSRQYGISPFLKSILKASK